MKELDMSRIDGVYAMKKIDFLRNHSEKRLNQLIEDGEIYEYLDNIQKSASEYVDNYIDSYVKSEEYKKIEAVDPFDAMRKLEMTILEADNEAYKIWIAALDEENEEE